MAKATGALSALALAMAVMAFIMPSPARAQLGVFGWRNARQQNAQDFQKFRGYQNYQNQQTGQTYSSGYMSPPQHRQQAQQTPQVQQTPQAQRMPQAQRTPQELQTLQAQQIPQAAQFYQGQVPQQPPQQVLPSWQDQTNADSEMISTDSLQVKGKANAALNQAGTATSGGAIGLATTVGEMPGLDTVALPSDTTSDSMAKAVQETEEELVNQDAKGKPRNDTVAQSEFSPIFVTPSGADDAANATAAEQPEQDNTPQDINDGSENLIVEDSEEGETVEDAPLSTDGAKDVDLATFPQEEPYDPIKENGVYFTGWEKPNLALVITGLLDGYIEPCGCAGMERMKGGLARRANFLAGLKKRGWPVLAVDAGLITAGYGFQEELKFDMAVNAFCLMEYAAIGISQNELRFPAHYLLKHTVPPAPGEQSMFVSANVGIYGFLNLYTLPFKTIQKNGMKIGVTSVVDTALLNSLDDKILTKPAEARLAEVLPEMKKEGCDHYILIAHGPEKFVEDLAAKFTDFDIIIAGDSPTIPPAEPKRTANGQFIVEVGEKGKYAVVLGIYADAVRYQRVALDSRYKQSKDVHFLMAEYQDILRGIVESKGFNGLGLAAVESPVRSTQGDYVGSSKCENCHEHAYDVWRHSRHGNAWKSISTDPPTDHTANPPRDCDPECVSCHVVGWNGQAHIPYVGGFKDMKTTARLANVGCESCHGPGSGHIAAELGNDEGAQAKFRENMRLGENVKQNCYSCHDSDNSPNFDFDTYFPKILHAEDGGEEN